MEEPEIAQREGEEHRRDARVASDPGTCATLGEKGWDWFGSFAPGGELIAVGPSDWGQLGGTAARPVEAWEKLGYRQRPVRVVVGMGVERAKLLVGMMADVVFCGMGFPRSLELEALRGCSLAELVEANRVVTEHQEPARPDGTQVMHCCLDDRLVAAVYAWLHFEAAPQGVAHEAIVHAAGRALVLVETGVMGGGGEKNPHPSPLPKGEGTGANQEIGAPKENVTAFRRKVGA